MTEWTQNDEDIDFSIIQPEAKYKKSMDLSVGELLRNSQSHTQHIDTIHQHQQEKQKVQEGSFLKDLKKMQKQLSYDTLLFNIYDNSYELIDPINIIQPKSQQTQLKTQNPHFATENESQGRNPNDIQYLIVDFQKCFEDDSVVDFSKFKNYFGSEILRKRLTTLKNTEKTRKINKRNSVQEFKNKSVKEQFKKSRQSYSSGSKFSISQNKQLNSTKKKRFDLNYNKFKNMTQKKKTSPSREQKKKKKLEKKKKKPAKISKEQIIEEYYGGLKRHNSRSPKTKKFGPHKKKNSPKKVTKLFDI